MRCRITGYIEARITRSRSMEEHAPSGPAVIYYGAVMKTLELGSRATEPQPCLSPHLKYTINMLKTRPELSEIATFPLPSCADKERVARPVFNSLVTRLVKASCLDPRILSRIPRLSRDFSQITAKHHRGSLSKISKFFEKVVAPPSRRATTELVRILAAKSTFPHPLDRSPPPLLNVIKEKGCPAGDVRDRGADFPPFIFKVTRIIIPREKMHRDRASRGGEEWWKWRHGGDRGTLAEVWLLVVNKNYAPDYSAFRFFSALIATHVSIAVGRCVRILVYLHPSISRAPSTLPEMKRGYSTHLPSLHGDTSPFQPPIHSYDATDIASNRLESLSLSSHPLSRLTAKDGWGAA